MKKLILIFMMMLTSNFFGQNADWTGAKTFKPTLKFVGLPVNNTNTKFMTLDANGKPFTSDVPVSEKITLTTAGTSGPATLVGSNLNIPIYPVGGIDPTALHLTTNETFTGIKSAINTTNTVTNAIELTNSPSSYSASNTHALEIVNSGLNGKGLSIINSSVVGEGFRLMHSGTAVGMFIGCNSASTTDVPMVIDVNNSSPKGNCMRINNQATSANDGSQTQGLGLMIMGATGSGTSLRIDHMSTQLNSPAVSIASTGNNLALKTSGDIECGKYKVPSLNIAPSSATATGNAGEIRFTATGIFICTASNTWIKCVGATF